MVQDVWNAVLEEIKKRKGEVSVSVYGEGPWCLNDYCRVYVEIVVGDADEKEFRYAVKTGKLVDSNGPYGLDFINWLAEQVDYLEIVDEFHGTGVHRWSLLVRS